MPVSISWCFPGLTPSRRLLKPWVGDGKSIRFTKVNEYLASLISPSEFTCCNNVCIWFMFKHTVSVPYYDGVRHTFPSSSRTSSITPYSSSTSSSSYSDVDMYTCTIKMLTGSACNLRAMILSLQTVFLTTFCHYALIHHYLYTAFSTFTSGLIHCKTSSPFHRTSLTPIAYTAFFCSFFKLPTFPAYSILCSSFVAVLFLLFLCVVLLAVAHSA